MMCRLHHRRLVQLYDAFQSDKEMCLIIEIIYGGELFDRAISKDFLLTEKACVCIMRQICEGVEFIHSQNIIHLDVKPENILCLSKTGNRIKIIDFGLARVHNPDVDTRVLFGTPEFMAPEVVQYDPIHFASDMWSIGVICYVLLSGLSPFMGDDDIETLGNVTQGLFTFDYPEFDNVSADARDIISKLLVTDKRKRLTATQCLQHPWLKTGAREPSPTLDLTKAQLRHYVNRRRWRKAVHVIVALKRMGFDKSPAGRSIVDNSVSGLLGVSYEVEAVGNFHLTNSASYIRLPNGKKSDEVESMLFDVTVKGQDGHHHHHHQQQQQLKHDGALNALPYCSQTMTPTGITPITSDGIGLSRNIQHYHYDRQQDEQHNLPLHNNSVKISSTENTPLTDDDLFQQQQQELDEIIQNLQSLSCANTVTSAQKTPPADDQVPHEVERHHRHHHHQHNHHQKHQPQQQQKVRPQNSNLVSINGSNTRSITDKAQTSNEKFLHLLENHRPHHHHHQPDQQRNATSKNWTSSTTLASSEFAQMTDDKMSRSHSNQRPPTSLPFQSSPLENPLIWTQTVGDEPPVPETEEKLFWMTMKQDSFDTSTLPRSKSRTTKVMNGEARLELTTNKVAAASTSVHAYSHEPVSRVPNWFNNHNAAAPTSKSKNASVIRDGDQFFTRNELAAAAAIATNNNSQTTTQSKTNWFRRTLFK